jgi:uncharacterized Zn-binding protein involved in type VI secretion
MNDQEITMAAAARLGDQCSGHGCFPPRTGTNASENVRINGKPAHRAGDGWQSHCCPKKGCHPSNVAAGSGTVRINGKPAARIGDPVACGSNLAQGSSNVFIGG